MEFFGKSVSGNIRPNNEDSIIIHDSSLPLYAAVADGMGGASSGEIASATVIESFFEYYETNQKLYATEESIKTCIDNANKKILKMVKNNASLYGMGSTLTFASFTNDFIKIAHVGDSSAYIFSNKYLKKLTKDHSYIQDLLDTGKYSVEALKSSPYKHFVTKAVGMDNLQCDYFTYQWSIGDVFLICSDGLTDVLDENAITEVLLKNLSIEDKVNILIDNALEAGSRDNISVILCVNSIGENSLLADRYLLKSMIAEGGFSYVYLASDVIEHKKIAVKLLKNEFLKDKSVLNAFKKEAEIGLSLKHKNIVNIFDRVIEKNINFICMDYVDGHTLKEVISIKKRISVSDTVNIIKRICLALEYAHAKGITHGDIKPENIIIQQNNDPCLMDFGVAGHIGVNLNNNAKGVGSIHYISPEQAKSKVLDRRTDIYSLGIVMYEMIVGHVPFEGESSIEIALKHINSEIPDVESQININLPESINRIILKATSKDRQHRYHSAFLMYKDLERCFEEPDGEYVILHSSILKNQKDKSNRNLSKNKFHKWIFVLIFAVAALMILIISSVFSNYVGLSNEGTSVVPNVVNMTVEEAEYNITSNDFTANIKYEDSSDIPEGVVIRQFPEGNEEIERDAVITIIVSSGENGY